MNIKKYYHNNSNLSNEIDDESIKKIDKVFKFLEENSLEYKVWYHPPASTIEAAMDYWKDLPGTHCKNLFFRNHKGNRHYLVIMECHQVMNIYGLEQTLKQGKLTFASPERMKKYLGVDPGSVTPFGLINDPDKQVTLFIDETLKNSEYLSFHPNDNRATIIISRADLIRFIEYCGNEYHFFKG